MFKVKVVDEASAQHRALVYLHIVGIDAAYIHAGSVVLPKRERLSIVVEFRPHLIDIGTERLLGDVLVAVVQFHAPPLAESVVRLRCDSAVNHHRVGEETVLVAHHGIDETIAGSKQHNEYEYAPRHGESRERSA